MKYLLVLFFVGIASAASIYDVSHDIDDETATELLVSSHFMDVLHGIQLADEVEDDKISEFKEKLREQLEKFLQKIKDAIEHGKGLKGEFLEKIKELKEKLKELKGGLSDKAKELIGEIKEALKDYLKKILEKIGAKDQEKRSIREGFNSLLEKLKKMIKDKLDPEVLKEKVEKLFGKGTELAELLLEKLKDKSEQGKQKILDWIDRVLGETESREERSIGELWQKIKDYFKDLGLDLKEKFMKFGEWAREKLADLKDRAKTKKERLHELAKEFRDHIKDLSKEVIAEGLEFLRPYKDDFSDLWDQITKSAKEILGRQD